MNTRRNLSGILSPGYPKWPDHMAHIGFLVNPVAGMGGTVGLKGTDGLHLEALRRGARPASGERACIPLSLLKDTNVQFFTCAGKMGAGILEKAGFRNHSVVYKNTDQTGPEDTREACRIFLELKVDLIVFCGGDGTARDVFEAVGDRIPLLGIPAGVKMYSGIFALNPSASASMMAKAKTLPLRDGDVVDVDEEAYRRGLLRTRIYGIAKTPYIPSMVPATKRVFESSDENKAKEEIGRFINEVMDGTPDTLYIIGPGSTTQAVADLLDVKKTMLGFDAVKGGDIVGLDLNEKGILDIIGREKAVRLIVSPIGAQGSVLGRGTQQVSPTVLRKVGIKNLIVVATPQKMQNTPMLFVDTGEPGLDEEFGESMQVITGYRIAQRKKLISHSGNPLIQ